MQPRSTTDLSDRRPIAIADGPSPAHPVTPSGPCPILSDHARVELAAALAALVRYQLGATVSGEERLAARLTDAA